MRTGDPSTSFSAGESNRRWLPFFVGASFTLGAALALLGASSGQSPPWRPPSPRSSSAAPPTESTYRNPILFADWSDPDVIRAGEDYFLVASSFHEVPGLPILHSKDLVHWTLAGHAVPRLPSPRYDVPRHGGGVWAPSIRWDGGFFHVWYGDPDLGLFTTRARDPRGPWEPLRLVLGGRGLIDPCPFRDADGALWLVHAWAKSRAGFNGVLTLRRLSPDGLSVVGDEVTLFDGGAEHPTIEGPKLYRRGGYVYVFAPAGGVKSGWQTVLRAKDVTGPYEARVVLRQGATAVNGPHQGALVETPAGESWFVHFQDRGPWGRVTHLQPVTWRDGWPTIGEDPDGDGCGQPVRSHTRPGSLAPGPPAAPQASDDFDGPGLGLMWQWNANPSSAWFSLATRPGVLRLFPIARATGPVPLAHQPNVLRTRFPAESFTATALVELHGGTPGFAGGLAVLGRDGAAVAVARTAGGWEVVHSAGRDVLEGGLEGVVARRPVRSGRLFLRVTVDARAHLRFATSTDGARWSRIGGESTAREGAWIGARLGLFTLPLGRPAPSDSLDVEWFRMEAR